MSPEETDALSLKLFGKNVNPNPSAAWIALATEEELAEWQQGDRYLEGLLASRIAVRRVVERYTIERMEEESGERHEVPEWREELDVERARAVPIEQTVDFPLRHRAGKAWGRCPFHEERTASFAIDLNKNLWYCHGCHRGGDAITFKMEYEFLDFRQAVKELLQGY